MMRRSIVAVAAFLVAGFAGADEDSRRTFTREFHIPAGSPLEVGLKVGEMEIETAAVDKVTVEIEAKITVPESSPLAVKMYAGQLRVEGGGQDLEIRVKYGDVTVHQPQAATQSVLADANFGDAQIYASSGDTNPRRPWLVGSRVTWDGGEGDATVTVNLSAGDATVHLD